MLVEIDINTCEITWVEWIQHQYLTADIQAQFTAVEFDMASGRY